MNDFFSEFPNTKHENGLYGPSKITESRKLKLFQSYEGCFGDQAKNRLEELKRLNLLYTIEYYEIAYSSNSIIIPYKNDKNLFLLTSETGKSLTQTRYQKLMVALQIHNEIKKFHNNNLVIGNLKPSNILVDKTCYSVSFIDFNICTLLNPKKLICKCQYPPLLQYAPPEYIEDRPLSFKTDIYCFGLVILYLFTNQNPYPFYRVDYSSYEEPIIPSYLDKSVQLMITKCITNLNDSDSLFEKRLDEVSTILNELIYSEASQFIYDHISNDLESESVQEEESEMIALSYELLIPRSNDILKSAYQFSAFLNYIKANQFDKAFELAKQDQNNQLAMLEVLSEKNHAEAKTMYAKSLIKIGKIKEAIKLVSKKEYVEILCSIVK